MILTASTVRRVVLAYSLVRGTPTTDIRPPETVEYILQDWIITV